MCGYQPPGIVAQFRTGQCKCSCVISCAWLAPAAYFSATRPTVDHDEASQREQVGKQPQVDPHLVIMNPLNPISARDFTWQGPTTLGNPTTSLLGQQGDILKTTRAELTNVASSCSMPNWVHQTFSQILPSQSAQKYSHGELACKKTEKQKRGNSTARALRLCDGRPAPHTGTRWPPHWTETRQGTSTRAPQPQSFAGGG